MRRVARGNTLVIVLVFVVALAALAVLLAVFFWSDIEAPIGGRTVLKLDLARGYPESLPEDPLAVALRPRAVTLREVVSALHRAAEDDRIEAVLARVGTAPVGLAGFQELRDAVLHFRQSGKKAIAHADTLGEFGPANGAYYLASAFDEIHLQPSGDVGLTGVRYEVSFLKGALEKMGLEARMDHRHEYKNAMNSYTESEFTAAHEEALRSLADSQFDQLVRGVAEGRELTVEQARELFDRGPFLGPEALAAGLVDSLAYRDEVEEALRKELGGRLDFVTLDRYRRSSRRLSLSARTVALIYGVGAVARGRSRYNPMTSTPVMGSDTVAQAFRDAVDDDDVEAILFRVDSPGGSYVASDTIWRETVRARQAGKPVVASMGAVAGSGGYFVAMAADAIVAQPGTVTGSIGVYAGKLVTREGWSKLGITWDEVSAGEHAGMWSGLQDFSPGEWERFQAFLDRVYDDFTTKAAEGRGMERERLLEVAKGRIWTGEQARELGLVDELGGYPAAARKLREVMGVDEDEPLKFKIYPRPKSPLELILERDRWVGERWTAGLAGRAFSRLLAVARRLGLLESGEEVLSMPEVPVLE